MLSNDHIKQKLVEKFNEQVTAFEEPYGMLTFEAPKELNLKVLNFLYDKLSDGFQLCDLGSGLASRGRAEMKSRYFEWRAENAGAIFLIADAAIQFDE